VPRHGAAGDRVLAGRFFHEAGRRDDPDHAGRDLFAADDTRAPPKWSPWLCE
jgi:hypothetical protein